MWRRCRTPRKTADGPAALTDILAPGLSIVFCGLNPAATAAASGHHFSNRSNRFWRTLHLAGFTPELVDAVNDRSILRYGYGLTALAGRPTARADQVSTAEFANGGAELVEKLQLYRPDTIAFLGKAGYAALTRRRPLDWGPQPEQLGGCRVWILPNPSGLNRAFPLPALVAAYTELRLDVESRFTAAG